jgi:prephenate dehydrogenase
VRVAFLGFGQIAGSVARALRASPDPRWRRAHLAAWSPTGVGPARAKADGTLDVAATDLVAALDGADIAILGAPPLQVLGLIDELGGALRQALAPDALVTDVASTKAAIMERAARHGLRFVGGHPMAGREQAGYGAADAALFVGRPWIVVPGHDSVETDVERVEDLARAIGANPLRMTGPAHDAATAAISHLPLLVSAALVEAVAGGASEPGGAAGPGGAAARPVWVDAAPIAAGGWRDTTRVARGDVAMGSGIIATNAGPISELLHEMRQVLDEWQVELDRPGGPDAEWIAKRLAAARDRLEHPPGEPGSGSPE